jgi:hypothetical protein
MRHSQKRRAANQITAATNAAHAPVMHPISHSAIPPCASLAIASKPCSPGSGAGFSAPPAAARAGPVRLEHVGAAPRGCAGAKHRRLRGAARRLTEAHVFQRPGTVVVYRVCFRWSRRSLKFVTSSFHPGKDDGKSKGAKTCVALETARQKPPAWPTQTWGGRSRRTSKVLPDLEACVCVCARARGA